MSTFSMNGSPTCTRRALGGHAVLEGLGGEDRGAADAVAAGARAEQDHLVADAATRWPGGCPRAAARRGTAR